MRSASPGAGKSAALLTAWLMLLKVVAPSPAGAYVLGYTVADMRQPSSQTGGLACPMPNHFNTAVAGVIDRRWSTSLGTSPVVILTQDQTSDGRLNEIETVIQRAFAVWTGVAGTSLRSSALGTLNRISTQATMA